MAPGVSLPRGGRTRTTTLTRSAGEGAHTSAACNCCNPALQCKQACMCITSLKTSLKRARFWTPEGTKACCHAMGLLQRLFQHPMCRLSPHEAPAANAWQGSPPCSLSSLVPFWSADQRRGVLFPVSEEGVLTMSALLTLGRKEECLGVVLSLLVGEPPSDALSSTTGGSGDPAADQAIRALFCQHLEAAGDA